jgi:hypothetical protein
MSLLKRAMGVSARMPRAGLPACPCTGAVSVKATSRSACGQCALPWTDVMGSCLVWATIPAESRTQCRERLWAMRFPADLRTSARPGAQSDLAHGLSMCADARQVTPVHLSSGKLSTTTHYQSRWCLKRRISVPLLIDKVHAKRKGVLTHRKVRFKGVAMHTPLLLPVRVSVGMNEAEGTVHAPHGGCRHHKSGTLKLDTKDQVHR